MAARTGVGSQVVTVWTTPEGSPDRFVWEGRRYVVCARPIPWLDRVAWWEKPTSAAPETEGMELVERRMWQVEAKAMDTGEILTLDLVVGAGQRWSVVAIFD